MLAVLVGLAVAAGAWWVHRALQPEDITAARSRWPQAMTYEAADTGSSSGRLLASAIC